jgi:hypothetical protein
MGKSNLCIMAKIYWCREQTCFITYSRCQHIEHKPWLFIREAIYNTCDNASMSVASKKNYWRYFTVESTVVGAKSLSMQVSYRNISMEKFIEVEENTRMISIQINWMDELCQPETRIKLLFALASMAEKFEQRCANGFLQNSAKSRDVTERMCKYLEAESSSFSLWFSMM